MKRNAIIVILAVALGLIVTGYANAQTFKNCGWKNNIEVPNGLGGTFNALPLHPLRGWAAITTIASDEAALTQLP
jgi:hypothetical protein